MPIATVRGVEINYQVLGERGPWVALQPGGRRGMRRTLMVVFFWKTAWS